MKTPNLLKKLGFILDKKQKGQLVLLGVMIFIGGILETLGVSAMIPVVTAILSPGKLAEYISRYEILGNICNALHIDITKSGSITTALIGLLIAIYIIKNAYLLFLVYRQNTFITRTRNTMISRVMREFLNRPYEDYLGADIPTVFRITDSDIPQTFSLMLALLNLSTEAVVSLLIFIVLLLQDFKLTILIILHSTRLRLSRLNRFFLFL